VTDDDDRNYNPNVWGFVTGLVSLAIFAFTYFTVGFPDMLMHVFTLPVIIGLIVRWQIRLNHTKRYRDD
jgi:hypothetical protein